MKSGTDISGRSLNLISNTDEVYRPVEALMLMLDSEYYCADAIYQYGENC